MSLKQFVEKLDKQGKLLRIKKKPEADLEAAALIKEFNSRPLLFENGTTESDVPFVANVYSTKPLVADYFDIQPTELIPKLVCALEKPSDPADWKGGTAPCQEVVENNVDLHALPIIKCYAGEGGRYLSSGIYFASDAQLGQNASYHRSLVISKNRFAFRMLPRHLAEFKKRAGGAIDAAVCVGVGANVALAGAMSVELGLDEMRIANALEPLKMVKCKTIDVRVPADAEFVLEGRILNETSIEGPFVDLTETMDVQRPAEPVFEVRCVTHRREAFWHNVLQGGLEHKILMGMPREPTIYSEVNKVCECVDVNITPGGCSWLHAVVKIKKKKEDDGRKAIDAAFNGHKSMKRVVIVDDDVDILDANEVEWAIATRFQADKNLVILPGQKGSSLDPSSEPGTHLTCKWGLDATKPLVTKGKDFSKVRAPKTDSKKFLQCG
ncbi:MAG: UbiD family decarboxylase [Candidatus Norongarragalinales archaeon]